MKQRFLQRLYACYILLVLEWFISSTTNIIFTNVQIYNLNVVLINITTTYTDV